MPLRPTSTFIGQMASTNPTSKSHPTGSLPSGRGLARLPTAAGPERNSSRCVQLETPKSAFSTPKMRFFVLFHKNNDNVVDSHIELIFNTPQLRGPFHLYF